LRIADCGLRIEAHGRSITTAIVVVLAALLPAMLAASRDFGATWDEPLQRARGRALLAYVLGEAPRLDVPEDGAHLYGAPLDVVSAALERQVDDDPYVIRHVVNAGVGWLGLGLVAWIGCRLFSPAVGLLALLLLATWPRYIAHAMNNPKDLPFAVAAAAVLLVLARVARTTPRLRMREGVLLALAIGAALNVRPGGLLFVAYLGAVIGYGLLRERPSARTIAGAGAAVGAVLAGAVAIGWLAWPWAYGRALTAPFIALATLSRFPWTEPVLFAGQSIPAPSLPPTYVPTWLVLSLPPVFLAGLVLSVVPALRGASPARDAAIALWASALFPIVYVVGVRATLYDEIRHLLFVMPPLAVLAALGWQTALGGVRGWPQAALGLLLVAGLAEPAWFQWRNHPHQIAYIQPLAGGPSSAMGRYELDYWGNCLLAGVRQVHAEAAGRPVTLAGWPTHLVQADATRLDGLRVVEPATPAYDRLLVLARGTREEILALDRRPDLIHRITTADGALLCAVLPGRAP
jgi:hypothetical protein